MSSAVETAKRNTDAAIATAKDVAADAPKALEKIKDNPSQATQDFLHTPFMRAALPFINGGTAGMVATTVIQPIDMIKVRLQLAGEGVKTGPKPSPLSVTREIIAAGRVLDLYTGLSAGLLRQAVYTTARLGFFDTFMKSLTKRAEDKGSKIGFKERATAGLAAGGLAAMVGNPADLALIRMQSDGLKPAAERANYRGVGDALTRIARNEGVGRLWAGATPTIVRAMALNFGQLAFFSEAKSQLKDTSLGPRTQTLTASAIAGFFASFFSLPFDFVKTRLQKQSRGPDGRLPYKNMIDCFGKVIREEGPLRFYRGFATYYVRIAPHAQASPSLVSLEETMLTRKQDDHADRGGLPRIRHKVTSGPEGLGRCRKRANGFQRREKAIGQLQRFLDEHMLWCWSNLSYSCDIQPGHVPGRPEAGFPNPFLLDYLRSQV